MESDLICNYKKCRNKIKDFAWVTSCSRDTNLPGKYDIVRMDLNPNEQYKSIILAGLSPDIILDICSRAMSFWVYQMQQELRWQVRNAGNLGERYDRLEQVYEQAAAKSKAENMSLKKELEASKQELEIHKKRSAELMEKLTEKSRQMQKIQTMYENLRRKCLSPVYLDKEAAMQKYGRRDAQSFDLPLSTVEEVMGPSRMSSHANARCKNNFVNTKDNQPASDFQGAHFQLDFQPQQAFSPMEAQFAVHLRTPRREFK